MATVIFPPRDESVDFFKQLNAEYIKQGYPAYVDQWPIGPGETIPLHVDGEGTIVWLQEYLRLRVNGYTHADACLDVFATIYDIWDPAGNPHPRPTPPQPEPGPTPPQPPNPGPDQPGVQDNMIRFAEFYLARSRRTGWAPDHTTTRETRIAFLQASVLDYRAVTGDKSFVMKRADASRPISDEVIVFMSDPKTGDYRRFWDFLQSGGASNWHVKTTAGELGSGEILPVDQLLVDPVTLQVIVG